MQKFTQYKVVSVTEGALGTIFLGASSLPLKKLEATMNKLANEGWQVVFQIIEKKRFMLFWSRETVILTVGK